MVECSPCDAAVLMSSALPAAWLVGLQMLVLVPTTLVMHDFWDYATGTPAHQIEFTNFIKVGVAGCGSVQSPQQCSRGTMCSQSSSLAAAWCHTGAAAGSSGNAFKLQPTGSLPQPVHDTQAAGSAQLSQHLAVAVLALSPATADDLFSLCCALSVCTACQCCQAALCCCHRLTA